MVDDGGDALRGGGIKDELLRPDRHLHLAGLTVGGHARDDELAARDGEHGPPVAELEESVHHVGATDEGHHRFLPRRELR